MAAAISFPCRVSPQGMCSKAMAGFGLCSLMPLKRMCRFDEQKNMKMVQEPRISVERKADSKHFLVMSWKNPTSPSDTIKGFYTCINDRNVKQLSDHISSGCCFEDCSFPKPFQGKKEVMQFFEQLTESMGPNVKFIVGDVCEGDNFTAGITWHLEWKQVRIPFTKGCTFIQCSKDGERLTIKKAQVMIESPFKPGGSVLILLKTVTSLFDDFPNTAGWLLKGPHWILKLLKMILGPFMNTFMGMSYITMGKAAIRLPGYAFKTLDLIVKIFFK